LQVDVGAVANFAWHESILTAERPPSPISLLQMRAEPLLLPLEEIGQVQSTLQGKDSPHRIHQ
jgi:hypothetical protein